MKFQVQDIKEFFKGINGTNFTLDLPEDLWNVSGYALDQGNSQLGIVQEAARWRLVIIQLQTFATPVIVCLGFVFNVVSVPVLCRRRLQVHPCSTYLVAMLLADTSFLLALLLTWLRLFGVRTYGRPGWCQALTLLTNMANFLSTWYPVALALESLTDGLGRMGRVCGGCASRNALALSRMIVLGLLVLSATIFVNTTLLVGVVQVQNAAICVPLPEFFHAVRTLQKMDIVFNGLLPSVVIICAWFWLVNKFLCRCCETPSHGHGVMWKRQRRLDRMLVILFLLLLLLQTPSSCLRLSHVIREHLGFDPAHSQILEYTLQHMFQYLSYAALASKGIILWLGWPDFRREGFRWISRQHTQRRAQL